MTKNSSSFCRLELLKRCLMVLLAVGLFAGVMLMENEKRKSPQPRAVWYWAQRNSSDETHNLHGKHSNNQASDKETSSTVVQPNSKASDRTAKTSSTVVQPNRKASDHTAKTSSTVVQPNSKASDRTASVIKKRPTLKTFLKTPAKVTTSQPKVYFHYVKTKNWGKNNKETWKEIYGDTSCPDNPRRSSLTAILKKWAEIAKQHKIAYALMWGSLIGVVRNNDVIPWDHDMDLLVHYKDILVLEKLGWPRNIHQWDTNTYINAIPSSEHNKSMDDRNRWNCQGKIVPNHVDLCSIQEPLVRLYNNGAFLDIFHFYEFKDTILTIPENHRLEIKKQDFYPFRPCYFMGVDVWCPNNPEQLLSDWYGLDFMKSVKKCKNGRWY